MGTEETRHRGLWTSVNVVGGSDAYKLGYVVSWLANNYPEVMDEFIDCHRPPLCHCFDEDSGKPWHGCRVCAGEGVVR